MDLDGSVTNAFAELEEFQRSRPLLMNTAGSVCVAWANRGKH